MSDSPAAPTLKLEIGSDPNLLCCVRALTNQLALRIGFTDKESGRITLAVDEALCNVINHGYRRKRDGRIWITVWEVDGAPPAIRIMLEDVGQQVEPATIRSRDLDDIRPGGLGVHIIEQIMDSVIYEKRPEGGMRLTMTKRASSAAADRREACCAEAPQPHAHKAGERHA